MLETELARLDTHEQVPGFDFKTPLGYLFR